MSNANNAVIKFVLAVAVGYLAGKLFFIVATLVYSWTSRP